VVARVLTGQLLLCRNRGTSLTFRRARAICCCKSRPTTKRSRRITQREKGEGSLGILDRMYMQHLFTKQSPRSRRLSSVPAFPLTIPVTIEIFAARISAHSSALDVSLHNVMNSLFSRTTRRFIIKRRSPLPKDALHD
jgi:hypothetical protein